MGLMAAGACPVSTINMQVGSKLLPIKKKTIRLGIKKRIPQILMLLVVMIVLQWGQLPMEAKFIALQTLVISKTSLEINFLTPSSLTISRF